MKTQIQDKIDAIINHILTKDIRYITYEEFKILHTKLQEIQYEEEAEKRKKDISSFMNNVLRFDNLMPMIFSKEDTL